MLSIAKNVVDLVLFYCVDCAVQYFHPNCVGIRYTVSFSFLQPLFKCAIVPVID